MRFDANNEWDDADPMCGPIDWRKINPLDWPSLMTPAERRLLLDCLLELERFRDN